MTEVDRLIGLIRPNERRVEVFHKVTEGIGRDRETDWLEWLDPPNRTKNLGSTFPHNDR